MKLLATLYLLLLLRLPTLAQTTIVGRVTDRATGKGLPGVTVLLKGSSNGTLTVANGAFALTRTPADSSCHGLVFSAINFITVERPAADSLRVALTQGIVCYTHPRASLALISGVRHTPFGATGQLVGPRLSPIPLVATFLYQTDFRRNRQVVFQLDWLELISNEWVGLTVGFRRATVRNDRQRLAVGSHSLTTGLDFRSNLPVLLLGAGYTRYTDEQQRRRGYGYEIGARHHFGHLRLTTQAQATRWPGYWQLQGEVSRTFWRRGIGLDTGLRVNSLGRYQELSLSFGYTFY